MYYTHVVSALDQYVKTIPDSQLVYFLNNIISAMTNAQRFHLGDFSDYRDNGMVPSSKDPLFSKEWGEGIRPPYDNIWVDFQDSRELRTEGEPHSPKAGVLFQRTPSKGEYYFITPISYIEGQWLPPLISFVKYAHTHHLKIIPCSPKLLEDKIEEMAAGFNRELAALNCFLRIINCKNVGTEDVEPATKINKSRAKKKKPPLVSYKILTVNVPSRRTSDGNASSSHGQTQRVHLRRGHYKTFSEEKPLFGKYTGTYWWQPSVRGSKKNGLVTKEYSLKLDDG